jgi:hypothetical protein
VALCIAAEAFDLADKNKSRVEVAPLSADSKRRGALSAQLNI